MSGKRNDSLDNWKARGSQNRFNNRIPQVSQENPYQIQQNAPPQLPQGRSLIYSNNRNNQNIGSFQPVNHNQERNVNPRQGNNSSNFVRQNHHNNLSQLVQNSLQQQQQVINQPNPQINNICIMNSQQQNNLIPSNQSNQANQVNIKSSINPKIPSDSNPLIHITQSSSENPQFITSVQEVQEEQKVQTQLNEDLINDFQNLQIEKDKKKASQKQKIDHLRNIILSQENINAMNNFIFHEIEFLKTDIAKQIIDTIEDLGEKFIQEQKKGISQIFDEAFLLNNVDIPEKIQLHLKQTIESLNHFIFSDLATKEQYASINQKDITSSFISYLKCGQSISLADIICLSLSIRSQFIDINKVIDNKEQNEKEWIFFERFQEKFIESHQNVLLLIQEEVIQQLQIFDSKEIIGNEKENMKLLFQEFQKIIKIQFYNSNKPKSSTFTSQPLVNQADSLFFKSCLINPQNSSKTNLTSTFQSSNFFDEPQQEIQKIKEDKIQPLIMYRQLLVRKQFIIDLIGQFQDEVNRIIFKFLSKQQSSIKFLDQKEEFLKILQNQIKLKIEQIKKADIFVLLMSLCSIQKSNMTFQNQQQLMDKLSAFLYQIQSQNSRFMGSNIKFQEQKEEILEKLNLAVINQFKFDVDSNIIDNSQLMFFLSFIVNFVYEKVQWTTEKLKDYDIKESINDSFILSNINFQIQYVSEFPKDPLTKEIYIRINQQNLNPEEILFQSTPFLNEKINLSAFPKEIKQDLISSDSMKVGINVLYIQSLNCIDPSKLNRYKEKIPTIQQFKERISNLLEQFENVKKQVNIQQLGLVTVNSNDMFNKLMKDLEDQKKQQYNFEIVELIDSQNIPQQFGFLLKKNFSTVIQTVIFDQKLYDSKNKGYCHLIQSSPSFYLFLLFNQLIFSNEENKKLFYKTLCEIVEKNNSAKVSLEIFDKVFSHLNSSSYRNTILKPQIFQNHSSQIDQSLQLSIQKNSKYLSDPNSSQIKQDLNNPQHFQNFKNNFGTISHENIVNMNEVQTLIKNDHFDFENPPPQIMKGDQLLSSLYQNQYDIQSQFLVPQMTSLVPTNQAQGQNQIINFIPNKIKTQTITSFPSRIEQNKYLLSKQLKINKFIEYSQTIDHKCENKYFLFELRQFQSLELVDQIFLIKDDAQIQNVILQKLKKQQLALLVANENTIYIFNENIFIFQNNNSNSEQIRKLQTTLKSQYNFYFINIPKNEYFNRLKQISKFTLDFYFLIWLTSLYDKNIPDQVEYSQKLVELFNKLNKILEYRLNIYYHEKQFFSSSLIIYKNLEINESNFKQNCIVIPKFDSKDQKDIAIVVDFRYKKRLIIKNNKSNYQIPLNNQYEDEICEPIAFLSQLEHQNIYFFGLPSFILLHQSENPSCYDLAKQFMNLSIKNLATLFQDQKVNKNTMM